MVMEIWAATGVLVSQGFINNATLSKISGHPLAILKVQGTHCHTSKKHPCLQQFFQLNQGSSISNVDFPGFLYKMKKLILSLFI